MIPELWKSHHIFQSIQLRKNCIRESICRSPDPDKTAHPWTQTLRTRYESMMDLLDTVQMYSCGLLAGL